MMSLTTRDVLVINPTLGVENFIRLRANTFHKTDEGHVQATLYTVDLDRLEQQYPDAFVLEKA